MNMEERWKDMPGFEEYYEISDHGNARSKERRYVNSQGRIITKHSKLLKPFIGGGGYLRFGLKLPEDPTIYKVMVNRKVAEAFIENPDPEHLNIVGHIDDVRTNNVYTNLYWTDQKENIQKAVKSDRLNFEKAQSTNSRPIKLVSDSNELGFDSLSKAAEFLGCSIGAVAMAKKHGHKCCGYKVVSCEYDKRTVDSLVSDDCENSCIGQIPVKIVSVKDKSEVWCNQINQAARKLNRQPGSVSEAAVNGTICNGYYVIQA